MLNYFLAKIILVMWLWLICLPSDVSGGLVLCIVTARSTVAVRIL
jgi:hypothetical protein